ncbi:unnamed protein product (macronuclear) [Paramecium tetraurelia]|uniref:Anoctamin transmembrane domain-containing protein n=1 Tax=Paramecium tetraurelia TaxID=5888 RepID=A0CIB0_PARTE|nr:uncharacterized protein GSPATT00007662001 [Paramecium tetraurelia]CAK70527.1 unnamed protein product [Paramecium tetraurelia]|eukprot:XP_001437924.1 hypothetical protein (macronuclear) [Paramecium tetraurelia strain d4-2]
MDDQNQPILQEQPKPKQKKPLLNTKMVKKQKMQNKKEENLREILNFYTNQVDARKFLQKMKAVVDSNQQEKKYQDDFLNPNEYNEMQDIYEDYNMGDLVIVFPNPDADGVKNPPITYKEAEKFYDETLAQKNDDVSESQLKKEKEAFLLAFLMLDDYQDDKTRKKMKEEEEKKKKEKEETAKKENQDSVDNDSKSPHIDKSPHLEKSVSEMKMKKTQQLKPSPTPTQIKREKQAASQHSQKEKPERQKFPSQHSQKENKGSNQEKSQTKQRDMDMDLSDFDMDVEMEDSELHEDNGDGQQKEEVQENEADQENEGKKTKKELNSYEKYLQFMEKYKKIEQEKLERFEKEEREAQNRKMKGQAFKKVNQDKSVSENDISVNQIVQQKSQHGTGDDTQYMDPIKELFKINLTDAKQFTKVKKQVNLGKYMEKVKDENTNEEIWMCNNSQPKDFMTLIRFTIIEKLMRNAFLHCRQFISSNGAQIFLVIKSTKQVVMRQAQKVKVVKQLELGFADLFSLEPVDYKLRPLRLKKYLRSYQSNSEEDQRIQARLIELSNQTNKEEKIISLTNISTHCEQLYDKVVQWKPFDLRLNLILKQLEIDMILKPLAIDLNIDQSQEKAEILNDEPISIQEWQSYFIYLECILCFGKQIQSIKRSSSEAKERLKEFEAFLYKLVFRKAISDANELWFKKYKTIWKDISNNRFILFNIWDRLEIYPTAPYTEFFIPQGEYGRQMWRKYEFNEKKQRSEFLNMEKIKLTHAIVLKHINIQKMLQSQIALFYIPIHDPYQLNGEPKNQLFQTLEDNEYINKRKNDQGQGDKKLDEVLVQLKAHAESTDYDCKSVKEDSAFNLRVPWHVPIQTYRDYFGEKVAIYFLFLTFYTKQLWYLSVVGVIFQGLQSLATPGLSDTLTVIFSSLIIIWSTFLIEYWRQEQVIFSLQYGQQNIEQVAAERPAFQGKFIRSITSDALNERFYSPFKRQITKLCAFGVSLLIIGMVVGCVIAIFIFKNKMIEEDQSALLSQTLPGIMMSAQINIFTTVYANVAKIFNFLENHKILQSFENSLVVKNFIFRFVNNFNSFFLVSFLSGFFPNLNICKVNEEITNDCFLLLSNQLSTIFSSNLTGSIPKLITPFVKEFSMKQIKNKLFVEKQNTHPFKYIDTQIEDQLGLDPYQDDKEEVDGSVLDYLEISIQFSYLILFGVSFPACYIMAFGQNILKIQVDKLRFLKFVRRPFPEGASSIGNWLIILDIITFLGIFVNAGLIVFTSGFFTSNQELIFPVILVSFLVLKYIIRFVIPSYPESARILTARQKCIIDKAVKGFSSQNSKPLTKTNFYSKIGNVSYENDIDELCVDEMEYLRNMRNVDGEHMDQDHVKEEI